MDMDVFITIPTYNESQNIGRLIHAIRALDPAFGIVVADDDSPDGTWKIVETLAQSDPRLFLLRRTQNKGRGSAGVDAFRFALGQGAEAVVEMDADFSHDPCYIPRLIEAVRTHDVVLGSRSVDGGKDLRPSAGRRLITAVSSFYARQVLGVPVKDCNSGYRCFRRRVLEAIGLDTIRSVGPSIVQELLYKAYLKGFSITEIPIVFAEREAGESNLNFKKLLQGFLMILRLKGYHLAGKF
jgi:dolichol-phosphate mannosyltransferase